MDSILLIFCIENAFVWFIVIINFTLSFYFCSNCNGVPIMLLYKWDREVVLGNINYYLLNLIMEGIIKKI